MAVSTIIRPEEPRDIEQIRRVHERAFPTHDEARLVDALRASGKALVSLVADTGGEVVGHILFSPVVAEHANGSVTGAGLAPVAVLPEFQRHGIATQLIAAGLAICRMQKIPFVVVLGDPRYYRRFGFGKAGTLGFANEYGADEEFMVLELIPDQLPARGFMRYAPEFASLGAGH